MKPFGPSSPRGRWLRALTVLAVVTAVQSASVLLAQTDAPRRRGDGEGGEGRRPPSAQDIQERMLSNLRERFGVTSDEEWGVISERMLKVFEARRAAGGPGGPGGPGMFPGRGGPPGRGDGGEGGRGPGGPGGPGGALAERMRGRMGGGSPEAAALQSAVADKLPEAEIKARLNQLRQTRKANEAKLTAAQEELRAVLTVRQEAMAVLMGLLN